MSVKNRVKYFLIRWVGGTVNDCRFIRYRQLSLDYQTE